MIRLAAVALIVAGLALPVCAQRGNSHGASPARAGGALRGGSTVSAPNRFSGSRGFAPSRSPGVAHSVQRRAPVNPVGRLDHHPDRDHHRRPYLGQSWARVPYLVAPYPGWFGPDYLGYPYDSGNGDSAAAPTDTAGGYDQQAPDQYQEEPRPPYRPSYGATPPSPAPEAEEAVTLVFKDGRPREQVRNYILTRSTLYIQDQNRRNIPLDQLDLVATAKANHDAGVDFQLPDASK